MGTEDMARQAPNVKRMRLLGAEVRGVDSGTRTLKDAINEAMRDWVTNVRTTHYLLGSVLGAHPYPAMVRDFQAVIGREARAQVLEADGRLPDLLVACVGGGSNAIGLFFAFLEDAGVRMVGVEAGGRSSRPGEHAARFLAEEGSGAGVGVLQGTRTYLLQDAAGNVLPTHSVSAGLDYPAVGPEHALLHDEGRVEYASVTDEEALAAFHLLGETEGILPALESAHAVAWLVREAATLRGRTVVVNMSGRGDKDLGILERGHRHEARQRQGQQPLRAGRRLLARGARRPARPRRGHHRDRRGRQDRRQGRPVRPGRPVLPEHREGAPRGRRQLPRRGPDAHVRHRHLALGGGRPRPRPDLPGHPAGGHDGRGGRLVDPDMLVEIEVDAVVGEDTTQRLPKRATGSSSA